MAIIFKNPHSQESDNLKASLGELLIVIESLRQFNTIEFEEAAALTRAVELQAKANKVVWAMWTQHVYDEKLKSYYASTLDKVGLFTLRLVDTNTVQAGDLLDHISASWEHLSGGTYEIYLAKTLTLEAMLIDQSREAGLFIYSARGYGTLYLGGSNENFVDLVRGLFQIHTQVPTCKLTLPPSASPTPQALDQVKVWLRKFYDGL